LAASPSYSQSYDEHFTVSKPELRIVNLIGEIQVTKHTGQSFDVVVHVRGKDASREAIKVRLDETARKLVVEYPLDKERNFVYPNLGGHHSKSTFHWNPDGGPISYGIKDLVGLGEHPKITVTSGGRGPELWADIEVRVPEKGRLEVVDGVGSVNAVDVNGDLKLVLQSGPITAEKITGELDADTGSGRVTITGVKGKVLADTGSGRVNIEDVDGDLNVDTGSGSVNVTRVRGDKVHADTGSGSVRLSEIRCEDLRVDTGSGGIELMSGAIGQGHFDTGSGGVELVLDQLRGGPIHVDTGSGSVTLDLPEAPSATINASTGSGSISVDLDDVDWVRKERDDKSFKVGKGEARVTLETGSGSIRVRS
ncbi:MAG TPA: DUF4097 family beta strand repeat-containing protein, partial [Candidatus Eisenbacteria bacterium]|nr:DUF4097 family beta strand repeat-containing protein [Candidatus Eisenbacteria bacterium]